MLKNEYLDKGMHELAIIVLQCHLITDNRLD